MSLTIRGVCMLKRFNGFLLVGLLVSLSVFMRCDDEGVSFKDYLSFYPVSNSTWFTFTDSTEYAWNTSGFENPGSGIYEQVAVPLLGVGQFQIVLAGGHQGFMTYDETELDITYIDEAGITWENVSGQSFTLTLYGWPDAGDKVCGIFSGTLRQFGDTNLKVISDGTFKITVNN